MIRKRRHIRTAGFGVVGFGVVGIGVVGIGVVGIGVVGIGVVGIERIIHRLWTTFTVPLAALFAPSDLHTVSCGHG